MGNDLPPNNEWDFLVHGELDFDDWVKHIRELNRESNEKRDRERMAAGLAAKKIKMAKQNGKSAPRAPVFGPPLSQKKRGRPPKKRP